MVDSSSNLEVVIILKKQALISKSAPAFLILSFRPINELFYLFSGEDPNTPC